MDTPKGEVICELEIFVAPYYRLLNFPALASHVDTCFTYQLVRTDVSQPLCAFHRPNIIDKTMAPGKFSSTLFGDCGLGI